MKRGVWIGALLLALLLAGCQSTDNGAQLAAPDSPAIFRVGATTVTVEDFRRRMQADIGAAIEQLLAQGQTVEEITQLADQSDVRRSIFDTMLQEELLLLVARQQGVGVDPAEIDTRVNLQVGMLRSQAPGSPNEFVDRTPQRVSAAREQLVFTMIARNTRADMFRSRHILVSDEATADRIIADLQAGASFADLARQFSNDSGSAVEGGDLGWVARGNFVPEFEQAAFSAELNTPVKVQSQFGWHIIEVQDRELKRGFDNIEQLQRNPNAQQFFEATFLPWYERLRQIAESNGDLEISPNFDPNSVPLPFPNAAP